MRRILILSLTSFVTNVCVAQFTDNFSDGDFTNNPAWAGTTSVFIVNGTGQLQLNNNAPATSYLTTPFNKDLSQYEVEWQGYVSQTFSPSGSNYGRVYLVSDNADLTQPLNGYYIQFGEALSADAPELFRQTGTTSTPVCRATTPGSIAASFTIRYKVTRFPEGLWHLLFDYSGGTNFVLEAFGTDATHTQSNFMGVKCVYTVTNANKFFYDDFSLSATSIPDTTPPSLVQVAIVDAARLDLTFSEELDPAFSNQVEHYSLNHAIGTPASAALQSNPKVVRLTFATSFKNGYTHDLTISGVRDLAGNVMQSATHSFLFFQATPLKNKDVVITEILADPTPQVDLPDAEFIEIYNRTDNPVDAGGWKLSDGSSTATLPSQIILPDEYWIVTSASNTSKFSGNGRVITVSNFPTMNNDGDALTLKTSDEIVLDSVNYRLAWYRSMEKQEGGWSLELIDTENICGEENNWTAAESNAGGTPGNENSVKANKPDLTGPKLLSATPVTPNRIQVRFDEKLENTVLTNSFSLAPEVSIAKAAFTGLDLKTVNLDLWQDLTSRQLYSMTIHNLRDCAGNLIQQDFSRIQFALPETPDSLDVLINEVLFNPRPNGVDFVEVYNHSPKYLDLKGWKLGNVENEEIINLKEITNSHLMLIPGQYLALCPDSSILQMQYPASDIASFLTVTLPTLNDDEGSVAVLDSGDHVIDYFYYSRQFHSTLIKDEEGVSLERISFQQPTLDKNNWKSASSVSGFATPGYLNSNARIETTQDAGSIVVEPEIFSPSSSQQEFAQINFKFEQSGFVANVKILDQQGRLIKTLANNETLGFEGSFRWDGDNESGGRARMGYYVVWFEVFDLTGSVKTYRKRVVVATRD